MKKPDLLSLFSQMLLTFFIGLSGIGCLATAFALPISAWPILFACAFFAVVTATATRVRHGWLILLGVMAMWGLCFWKKDAHLSLLSLLRFLTDIYRMAYAWDIPGFIANAEPVGLTLAVTVIAAVCTLIAGMGLATGQAYSAVFALLLPVVPCFVVIDTVPAPLWLLAMIACLVLILLSQNVRAIDPRRAGRVVAFAMIPVLLGGWLLMYFNPQESYQRPSQEEDLGDRFLEYADKLPYLKVEDGQLLLDYDQLPDFLLPEQTMPPVTMPPVDITLPPVTLDPGIIDIFKEAVSLENAGPRNPSKNAVMQISTTFRGTIYLRERGYDVYTGTSWESSGDSQMLDISKDYLDIKARSVTITTLWPYSNYFVPYYSEMGQNPLEDGKLPNPNQQKTYKFKMYGLRSDWKGLWQDYQGHTLAQIEDKMYTALPDSTLAGAQLLLAQIGVTEDTMLLEAVMRIRNFVRDSASYDLDTETMPEEFEDFALWFLNESETGYCVHFATAATVLLRAAGIPARYVEGYMVSANGSTTDVLGSDAHAWVEYFVPDVGWVVLEATPGGGTSPVLPPDPSYPTIPIQPTTTQPTEPVTTVPTEPATTLPTLPTESTTTAPTTTAPTVPTTSPTTTAPTAPTTTPATTVPGTTAPTQLPPEPKDLTALWTTLAVIFGLLSAGCGLYGQWQLRLWCVQQWLQRGDTNRRAVKLWRRSLLFAWLRRQNAPQTLRDLAWKAKFSQHIITDAELDMFLAYRQRSIADLQSRPWYLKLAYRFLFAAY